MQVHPPSFDLYVCFVYSPGIVGYLEFGPAFLFKDGGEAGPPTPAVDGGVVYGETAFNHHFFKIAVAQRVPELPANTAQYDLGLVMALSEHFGLGLGGQGSHDRGSRCWH